MINYETTPLKKKFTREYKILLWVAIVSIIAAMCFSLAIIPPSIKLVIDTNTTVNNYNNLVPQIVSLIDKIEKLIGKQIIQ